MTRSLALCALLSLDLLLLLACAGGGGFSTPQEPADSLESWPQQPAAAWPPSCLLENAAPHPSQPWLALACTNAEAGTGAVLVFDASTGKLRSSTPIDQFVGWSDAHLMRWHPDGLRLTTNIGTNGIALLDKAEVVGVAYPDETRDGGVTHLWVGDRLYTDTGALFTLQPGARFDFDVQPAPTLQGMVWNAQIGAAVGALGLGLAAYDPVQQAEVYRVPSGEPGQVGAPSCAQSGRWCVRQHYATHPAADRLLFLDGDTGKTRPEVEARSPRLHRLIWGPHSALAVTSHVHIIGGDPIARYVEAYFGGVRRWTRPLEDRRVLGSFSIPEASGIAWSADEGALALLLDGEELRVVDGQSGDTRLTFAAPSPPMPAGLPDWYLNRKGSKDGYLGDVLWVGNGHLVRIAPHFVGAYTAGGEPVSQLVVPVASR